MYNQQLSRCHNCAQHAQKGRQSQNTVLPVTLHYVQIPHTWYLQHGSTVQNLWLWTLQVSSAVASCCRTISIPVLPRVRDQPSATQWEVVRHPVRRGLSRSEPMEKAFLLGRLWSSSSGSNSSDSSSSGSSSSGGSSSDSSSSTAVV